MSTVAATTSSTSSTGDASDALSSTLSGSNATLGQDAFMKLLVAQIQHQDPLNPQSDTEFVSQLAQFSSLQQQTGTNKLLELVSLQQKGLANSADVDLVGKTVTVQGNTVTSTGQGYAVPGSFTLGADATTVKVSITDASGNVVRTMSLGAHAAGSEPFSWDGRSDAGVVQPAGNFTVSVDARDANGNAISVSQQTTGVVTGVSFGANGASLTLADGTQASTSDLTGVSTTPAAAK